MPLGLDARQAIPISPAPDTKPDTNRVYSGMNVGAGHEDGRKVWWNILIGSSPGGRPSLQSLDSSHLSALLLGEIEMELEVGHFSRFVPTLAPSDFDAIRRILQREAIVHERESLGLGHAHLAARLFLACERDENRALDIMVLVTAKLRAYEADAPMWSLLRNDVLRLVDLMLANQACSALCEHFNENGFDLVDLSDVIVTWFGGLFSAAAFPTEFCLRCVDVLLLPSCGPEQLVGVLFGTLHVLQMKLLECTSSEALFTALADLPAALTKAQIGEVFAQAFWVHGKCAVKNDADWNSLIAQVSGPLRFQSLDMMKAMSSAGGSMPPMPPPAAVNLSPVALHLQGPGVLPSPPRPATHAHASSMTFNLSDYSPSSRPPAAAPVESIAAPKEAHPVDSLPAPVTVSPSLASDPTILADLLAATGSANKNPAQLQQLLERAIKQLKLHQATPTGTNVQSPSPNAPSLQSSSSTAGQSLAPKSTSPVASLSAASSAPSGAAALLPASSDVTLGVRGLAQSVYQIAPLEVHPMDRTSGSNLSKKLVPQTGIIKYSELLEYQLYPCLLMQGYLMKARAPNRLFKFRGSSGFFGSLHRRYFVLQGSFLTYFKTHEVNKPTRDESVDLRCCVATKIKNHEYGPFAFKIESKEKGAVVYLLFASNETVRDVWLECLAQATQVPAIGV